AADSPSLRTLLDVGGTLVPHFDALLEDLFCLLFKMEPRVRSEEEVAPSAAFNRTLLDGFHEHPLLEHLREQTQLDEAQAGLGTLLIGAQVLALLRQERLLPRGDLLDLWDLARTEDELRARGEELKDVTEVAESRREGAEHA